MSLLPYRADASQPSRRGGRGVVQASARGLLTFRAGQVVAIRACRDRDEALALARIV